MKTAANETKIKFLLSQEMRGRYRIYLSPEINANLSRFLLISINMWRNKMVWIYQNEQLKVHHNVDQFIPVVCGFISGSQSNNNELITIFKAITCSSKRKWPHPFKYSQIGDSCPPPNLIADRHLSVCEDIVTSLGNGNLLNCFVVVSLLFYGGTGKRSIFFFSSFNSSI